MYTKFGILKHVFFILDFNKYLYSFPLNVCIKFAVAPTKGRNIILYLMDKVEKQLASYDKAKKSLIPDLDRFATVSNHVTSKGTTNGNTILHEILFHFPLFLNIIF